MGAARSRANWNKLTKRKAASAELGEDWPRADKTRADFYRPGPNSAKFSPESSKSDQVEAEFHGSSTRHPCPLSQSGLNSAEVGPTWPNSGQHRTDTAEDRPGFRSEMGARSWTSIGPTHRLGTPSMGFPARMWAVGANVRSNRARFGAVKFRTTSDFGALSGDPSTVAFSGGQSS